ncbi:CD3324 family protein [Bacilliculturomica massiliensis]|uniref:CD3324 family protein n=1 Tax=Bacilliculturomica massiliensis TaxID=1917867 RepID=UPI001032225C|nr:CD3324 family protein [Bacilliculturomica massiliensis]
MKYVNARTLLPEKLVRELQEYIQGGYIYVPAGMGKQRRWGELSGYRKELERRNRQITEEYRAGYTVDLLADRHGLSVYAIRKIIYRK